jgi:phenylacetate-CoA ligase
MLGYAYRAIPLSVRYGKTYTFYHRLLQSSPYWDDQTKHDFVIKQLKETLINAYENTSYYQNAFDKLDFNPYTFETLSQIEKIPIIDKDIIRKHKKEIINKTVKKENLLYVTTGGTTGVPVELFYIKGRERSREYAFINEMWKRIGYKPGDKTVVLRGTVINEHNNTITKFDPIKNRLLISTYDLNDKNFIEISKAIMKFNPSFIHAYPSSAAQLANYYKSNNTIIPQLKGIFCGSEQFYPGQRELIESTFNTRVYSWYGHTEYTALAGECELSNDYHLFFEYGYTELIDENGKVITRPGVLGEIVGTSFEMTGFPIIRYKTGDFAEYSKDLCACGRNHRLLINVHGRRQIEQIITKDDSLISVTALNMHTDIFDNVKQFQFVQEKKGELILNLIKGNSYSFSDEDKIYKQLNQKLKRVDLKIKYVDQVLLSPRGKYKFLVQKLKKDFSYRGK